jgi:hypothetical protein
MRSTCSGSRTWMARRGMRRMVCFARGVRNCGRVVERAIAGGIRCSCHVKEFLGGVCSCQPEV